MVPVVVVPPTTPFTDHATAGEEPSAAWAVNCSVLSPRTLAFFGLMLSCICGGRGFPPDINPEQPAKKSTKIPVDARQMRFTASLPLQIRATASAGCIERSLAVYNSGQFI